MLCHCNVGESVPRYRGMPDDFFRRRRFWRRLDSGPINAKPNIFTKIKNSTIYTLRRIVFCRCELIGKTLHANQCMGLLDMLDGSFFSVWSIYLFHLSSRDGRRTLPQNALVTMTSSDLHYLFSELFLHQMPIDPLSQQFNPLLSGSLLSFLFIIFVLLFLSIVALLHLFPVHRHFIFHRPNGTPLSIP